MVAILTRQKKSVKDDAAEVKLPCAIIGYNNFFRCCAKKEIIEPKIFLQCAQ